MDDVAAAAAAVKKLWGCTKVNLGAYGDKLPHLHFHIVPKYEGGPEFGGSFAISYENPVFLSDDEYAEHRLIFITNGGGQSARRFALCFCPVCKITLICLKSACFPAIL